MVFVETQNGIRIISFGRQINERSLSIKRKINPKLLDADNPEWTAAEAGKAATFSTLPKTLQSKLARRARGAQLAPTKERITIRLSPDVVKTFRATGAGW